MTSVMVLFIVYSLLLLRVTPHTSVCRCASSGRGLVQSAGQPRPPMEPADSDGGSSPGCGISRTCAPCPWARAPVDGHVPRC
jgi:hypothetical protein